MTDGEGNRRFVVLLVALALGLGLAVLGVPIVLVAVQQAREAARQEQAGSRG